MSNSDDFLSFENALRELQLRSEELKKLVSEGEIRAYRDPDSDGSNPMKFRAEDVAALSSSSQGGETISFADSLEDDTGMVTEEISDEDTLLAEDDVVVEEIPRRARAARPERAPRAVSPAAGDDETPGWVAGVAVISALLMIWAFMVGNSLTEELAPEDSFFTSIFADKK